MPNHITTLLEASPEVIAHLKSESRLVDFNTVIPMPEILRGHEPHCGVNDRVEAAMGINTQLGSKSGDLNAAFAGIHASNMMRTISTPCPAKDVSAVVRGIQAYAETGFVSWYEWSIEHWGTKWNAYASILHKPGLLEFETAWSFPAKVLTILSAKYPKDPITAKYADEDWGNNCGIARFVDGDMTKEAPADPLKFAFEVCGVDEESQKEYFENIAEEARERSAEHEHDRT